MIKRSFIFLRKVFGDIFPAEFRGDPAYWRRIALAVVMTFLIITQLFTFEDFADVTGNWQIVGSDTTAALLAAIIPLLELGSLPFLLTMRLSRVLWRASQVSLLLASALWIIVTIWCVVRYPISESGLFGATLPVANGWWTVVFTGLLGIAALSVVLEVSTKNLNKQKVA